MADTATRETHGFQAEVKQLLHLMVHSLYSNKEIFLRELVSNASDAADKLRFEAMSDKALFEDDGELRIRVSFDKAGRTITALTLAVAGWLLLITTLDAATWATTDMLYVYRARWQVELFQSQDIKFIRDCFFSGRPQPVVLQRAPRGALRLPHPDTRSPFPRAAG